MRSIDISCDLGEAADATHAAVEAQVWPLITSANIACGGHTGDEGTMRQAVDSALRSGVVIGAHPSYPDRENFGRKSLTLGTAKLIASLAEQLEALRDVTTRAGATLSHVKPHGALYNDAHADLTLARTIVAAVAKVSRDLSIVCSPWSMLSRAAEETRLGILVEGFGDRRYWCDGTLVERSRPDALLIDPEEAAAQARDIVLDSIVRCVDALPLDLQADTLCFHADMPDVVQRISRTRELLAAEGVRFEAPNRSARSSG